MCKGFLSHFTGEKEGLYIGEEFILRLWRYNEGVVENITIDSWREGNGVYSVNGISIVGSISENTYPQKQLIKITDILGREIDIDSKKSTLLYIYDDGSVEKKYILE